MKAQRPPGIARFLLRTFFKGEDYFEFVGDLEEIYSRMRCEGPRWKAAMWYRLRIVESLPGLIADSLRWRIFMFRNYLKTAFRHLRLNPGFTTINVAGLALGLACCILILLWVHDEWNYDRFHSENDRIYRVVNHDLDQADIQHYAVSPIPMAPTLKAEYPDIAAATRFGTIALRTQKGENFFLEYGCVAEPDFLSMFSFPLIAGDPAQALADPLNIILTRSLAQKYFDTEEAVGQTLTTTRGTAFKVTGVMEDVPRNSHMQFDFILPFEIQTRFGRRLDNWEDVSWTSYVLLREGADPNEAGAQADACNKKYRPHSSSRYYLQPLSRIHLFSHHKFDFAGRGDIRYVAIFTCAALLVLVIACFNFMNLITARSVNRAKEVGIRKVAGARRIDIVQQFFLESLYLVLMALGLALVTAKLFLPVFNRLSGKQLALNLFAQPAIWIGLAGLALLTGVMSGTWPALFLSSFQPAGVIKRKRLQGTGGASFRKILVVGQFALSIILLTGTMGIFRQVEYMKTTDLGFDKDHVIFFSMPGEMREHYETAKTELLRHPNVLNVTAALALPIYESSGTSGASWEGKREDLALQMRVQSVDSDFLKTFGVEMAQGRFFSKDNPADLRGSIVLNETAVREMGLEDPVGKRFRLGFTSMEDAPIIGVIRDYQLRSMRDAIEPMVLHMNPDSFNFSCLKIRAADVPATLAHIEKVWKNHSPKTPFSYRFLDEAVGELYLSEDRMSSIFKYFTVLAGIISALGVFGLASYMAEQRTKEIGIRRVLGASVSGICVLMSKDFLRCVVIANLIAWPVAGYALSRWMEGFAGRAGLSVWIFALSGGLALVIALLSVSWQSLRAATADPARALRYE